jgi:aspartyl-tRNA(Asn)/glutamyl-tRNA(Gln) amidotransferase subunit B
MRSKEEAHDYRYFPDPDLLPLEFSQDFVDGLKAALPELPDAKKARFMSAYGLLPYDAGVLVADKETADFFEACVAYGGTKRDAKIVANWVNGDIAAFANSQGVSVPQTHITPAQIAGLVDLIANGTISGKIAKDVLAILINEERDGDPKTIVETRGLKQVTDTGAIEAAVDAIIAANPDKVEQAKAKLSMLGWFVGQVMKQTGGRANPQGVNNILKRKLGI